MGEDTGDVEAALGARAEADPLFTLRDALAPLPMNTVARLWRTARARIPVFRSLPTTDGVTA